jgi:isopenicillin N synthase-like dioxygenase
MNGNRLVIIDYKDLSSDPSKCDLSIQLSQAFGSSNDTNRNSSTQSSSSSSSSSSSNGDSRNRTFNESSSLGVIAIRNVPSFVETKQAFLPLAHTLAHLSPEYLETELTDKQSMYNAGWSHGKEKLGDTPDFNKASFYFNPITDMPGTEEDRQRFPASYPINKWPEDGIVEGLETLGKKMGRIMCDTVALLAKHVDVYVKEHCACHEYDIEMGKEMETTEKVKGRLLYYYPLEQSKDNDPGDRVHEDSWIGWHNDSGFFTALAGDMYVNHDSGEIIPRQNVDPNAGLAIMDRNGNITKVEIPDDCMAIQIGECLQIVTGGNVIATPHCVRGVSPNWNGNGGSNKIARISFPCFVDTVPSFPLKVPRGISKEKVMERSVKGCAKIPPLSER